MNVTDAHGLQRHKPSVVSFSGHCESALFAYPAIGLEILFLRSLHPTTTTSAPGAFIFLSTICGPEFRNYDIQLWTSVDTSNSFRLGTATINATVNFCVVYSSMISPNFLITNWLTIISVDCKTCYLIEFRENIWGHNQDDAASNASF